MKYRAQLFTLCILSLMPLAARGAPTKANMGPYKVEVEMRSKGGEPQTGVAQLWLPDGVKKVRGLFYPGTIVLGPKLAKDPVLRATLAEKGMGILYLDPGLGSSFIRDAGVRLEKALADLAKASGHPEVEFAPLLSVGHSADGHFARDVAYWKPERTLGVLLLKSGNFQQGIEDMSRTLAGVPLMMITGEFEEYGPEGGDPELGVGLRAEYSLDPDNKKKQNQTQWVMARMQMLARRAKNPDNLWSLVVHRGKSHMSWDNEVRDLACQFVRSCADARIPGEPDGKSEVHCRKVTIEDCWLYDADIKTPKYEPAPYAQYQGSKEFAFAATDKTLALAIYSYHQKGWPVPDPTAGEPAEKRFVPPAMLTDLIDAPDPQQEQWKGGSDEWAGGDSAKQMVFAGDPGTVALTSSVTCTGLIVGPGYTLVLGDKSLRSRWHAMLAADSTVVIRVMNDAVTGKPRAGKLVIEGNAQLAGTLKVESTADLPKGGKFLILKINGLTQGQWSQIVLPEGWTMAEDKHGWNALAPKPGQR